LCNITYLSAVGFFSLSNCTYVGSLQIVMLNVLGEISYIILFYFAKCSTSCVPYPAFLKCVDYTVKNIGLIETFLFG